MNQKVCAWLVAAGLIAQFACAEEAAKTTAAAPAANAVPKIKFDKTVYDFGSTSMVQKLEGKFVISNVGSATLENIKAQPSCGCTTTKPKIDKLAPGESTDLPFTVNVGMPRGHLEKHITVTSNDPQEPSVNLTLKADIVPTFDVIPPNIGLGNIHQGETTNITVEIKRLDGKPLGLTRAESGNPSIHPKLGTVEGSNQVVELTVEIVAGGSPHVVNDQVRLYAGDAPQPAIVIPVNARIVGDISARPEAQFWGIVDPDNWPGAHPEQATRKFTIVSNKPDANFEIKKATTDLAGVTVSYSAIVTGKTYEVVATLDKAPKQSERGKITLETNLPSQPTLELALTINVLRRN
jgi:hypothetical protein